MLESTADAVRLSVASERDVREDVFFAFAAARLPILELRPRTATLEQVFLDLTDDNDAVAARAAALLGSPAPAEQSAGTEETEGKEASADESDL